MRFDDYLFHRDKNPEPVPAEREVQSGGPRTEATAATAVLDTILALGSWKTTGQIGATLNRPVEEVLPQLEGLRETGSVERDGANPLFIWKAAIEERLRYHGALIAIDRGTGEALPLFKAGDADIVKGMADAYLPFEVLLTPAQREELTASLDYYERLIHRPESPERKDKQS